MLLAAHLPNPHILLLPGHAHVIDNLGHMLPTLMADGLAVFVGQVHRVQQLTKNIQLHLIKCAVANPHRPGAAVSGQVAQLYLGQIIAAVNAVHDVQLQGLVAALPYPATQPAHKAIGLIDKAQAHKGINREGRIANPGIAVIPVTLAPRGFRQAKGGGRNDRALLARGQQLEGQGRAVDHFPPASAIDRLCDPLPPELQGAL